MAESKLFIGSKLKSARRKNKIKISRVVEDLCIPKKFIAAFEKNDLSEFPNKAYAIGYLKSYASYLGLDQGAFVNELKAHLRDDPFDIQICRPMQQTTGPSWLARAAVILLIGLVATGAYFGWSYYQGNDYKQAEAAEIPAHLVSFLEEEKEAISPTQGLLAKSSDQYFQNLGGTGAKVRILAFADIQLAIMDASGNILHQGLMFTGESFDLPRGADLHIKAADYSALGFFLGSIQAWPDYIKQDGIPLIALDSLITRMNVTAPTS